MRETNRTNNKNQNDDEIDDRVELPIRLDSAIYQRLVENASDAGKRPAEYASVVIAQYLDELDELDESDDESIAVALRDLGVM